MNERRCHKLITQAIGCFGLDLSGRVVLTEAATGYYILTPLIAALAGAKQVFALTRDSRFGTTAEVSDATMKLARQWGAQSRVEVLSKRDDVRISEADIVTNLGFVRPLNTQFLRRLKKTAVIPLMWETWEFRSQDLDLEECRRLGLCVLGTNEHHPSLQIFKYIGPLALKLLFEAGIEVFCSRLLIIGSGEFAEQVLVSGRVAGAQVSILNPKESKPSFLAAIQQTAPKVDALIVVEHSERRLLIGHNGDIDPEELHDLNPSLAVIHICGGVEREALVSVNLHCWPEYFAPAGYMSVGTDYLGPKQLVDLHTAGLKIGELLAHTRMQKLSPFETESMVLSESSLAQGFRGYHDV